MRDTLFPYARARLPALITYPGPAVQAALASVPGPDQLATLLGWMDGDVKAGPLKTLQGIAWADGYVDGSIVGALYPDVAPALARWQAAGIDLAVYSSGSVAAQRLLFRHSVAGDLEGLFSAFFDTATGGKREAASYRSIATACQTAPTDILFLSDVAEELDAADQAGLTTCQLIRPEDGTVASGRHRTATTFDAVLL